MKYIGVRYSWILSVLGSVSGSRAAHTFEYSRYKKSLNIRSILGLWVIVRPFPHRFDNSIPFLCRKISQTVPRVLVRANHFRGEQLEYFRSTGSISGVYTAILAVFRVSVLRILCIFPSISGFDTADTPVLAVLLLLILPVMALFRPSVLLILPVLAVRNVLDTPEYTRST